MRMHRLTNALEVVKHYCTSIVVRRYSRWKSVLWHMNFSIIQWCSLLMLDHSLPKVLSMQALFHQKQKLTFHFKCRSCNVVFAFIWRKILLVHIIHKHKKRPRHSSLFSSLVSQSIDRAGYSRQGIARLSCSINRTFILCVRSPTP